MGIGWEALAVIEEANKGGHGQMWMGSRYVLEEETIGIARCLDLESQVVKVRKESRMTSRLSTVIS